MVLHCGTETVTKEVGDGGRKDELSTEAFSKSISSLDIIMCVVCPSLEA